MDATHEPDLFWALRGGNGNYGVVTAIEFAVYPVEDLYAGVMFFPFERAAEVLHTWTELEPTLPDELMSWASLLQFPDAPDVPEAVRGGSFTVVYGAFLGSEDEGRALLRPIRDLGPVMDTFAVVPPAALGDMAMDPPDPLPIVSAGALLSDLPSAGVDDLLAAVGPGSGSPAGHGAAAPAGRRPRAPVPGCRCSRHPARHAEPVRARRSRGRRGRGDGEDVPRLRSSGPRFPTGPASTRTSSRSRPTPAPSSTRTRGAGSAR